MDAYKPLQRTTIKHAEVEKQFAKSQFDAAKAEAGMSEMMVHSCSYGSTYTAARLIYVCARVAILLCANLSSVLAAAELKRG